jgi:glutamate racemase
MHKDASSKQSPIGIFDSGVGGLSVLRAIQQQIPHQDLLFLADQAHVPYGPRPLEEVRAFSFAITRFLVSEGARLIVVACNTASAAALHELRLAFPNTLFVGMEPAVKPAAEHTRSGVVGVLATPATFQGALYASVVERFAQGVQILQDTCPGLVLQIELGELDTPTTRMILERALHPMLAQGVDTIVLGCTHYPFLIPQIKEICGPDVRVIDPAPAVARQVGRLLKQLDQPGEQNPVSQVTQPANLRFLTSGSPEALQGMLTGLLSVHSPVEQAVWGANGELRAGKASGDHSTGQAG